VRSGSLNDCPFSEIAPHESSPICRRQSIPRYSQRDRYQGDRHPDTAQSLNNLAGLYRSQGRYGEAEPLYLEALAIRKAELGDRHPDTAGSLFNLAELYHQTKRHHQALPLIQEAIAIYIPALGAEHPNTQAAQSWLQAIQQATSSEPKN